MWVVGAPDGETSIRLLDFGISKMPDARKLTATGVAIGTPHYMAPEQLAAQKPDPRSDIYAFGVILYQVFSGHLPFCSDDLQALISRFVIDLPPPLVPGNGYAISRKLDRLIRDCLRRNSTPDRRARSISKTVFWLPLMSPPPCKLLSPSRP